MSYEPTQWSAGDTVTSAKLNKMEQGISNNGVLEINAIVDEETGGMRLDKTWQEIYNANNSIIIVPAGSEEYPMRTKVILVGVNGNIFTVVCLLGENIVMFSAPTSDDYPIFSINTDDNSGGNSGDNT